jgi:hypothetical protein
MRHHETLLRIATTLLCASAAGCLNLNNSSPAAPPIASYEQAWMQAHSRQEAYAHGYATVGYAPDILTIPGHPFTAKRTYTEWKQDGSPDAPVVTTTFSIARDSDGRIHYESSRQRGEIDVLISDPVDHINYRYFIKRRPPKDLTAEKCTQPLMRDITSRNTLDASPSLLAVTYQRPMLKDRRNDLGTQDFEGVLAYGQQTLHTVSNQYGTKLMAIERWFSPDLGLNLLQTDDIEGQNKTSIRTHDLQYTEPDQSLFQPPPGYALPAKIPSCIKLNP